MSSVALPRPAERVAIITILLVFLCGGVTGAMVMSYWFHPHHVLPSAGGLTISIREWQEKLDLSPEQTRQLNSILDDFSRYYDNLLSDGNSRVLQILNPEQKRKYEIMLREHKR
jgi:hypothetical protein